jgi:hypothetical protein
MATKKKTQDEKPVKKKTYKKPTADKMADKDLAGVAGGADKGSGEGFIGCAAFGATAVTNCGVGGAAAFTCAPTGGAAAWGCHKGSKP